MRAFQVHHGKQIDGLTLISKPDITDLDSHEVKVRIRAVSLNYRDLMITQGIYPAKADHGIIPASDFAGEVIAVGSSVTRFQTGDRVMASFFPDWLEGELTLDKVTRCYGGDSDGVLREEIALPESGLVKIPSHLDYISASTLPCAGVTAWNSIFESTKLQPGSTVLVLGTGGVSIMALLLAKAAGHKVFITSSSNAKLEQARTLGADATINYIDQPEWQEAVLDLTQGKGVDLVLEVGGKETVQRSLTATGTGGTMAIIGGVSGFTGTLDPISLLFGAKQAKGIFVGSRAMLESLSRFTEINNIKPVIDEVFSFDQVPQAYEYMAAGKHFGKVVIKLD
ncbi:NAD(P)-dependent alcohol dehydrogenase [Hahella sp. CCB-MM4]|uniref:zinc-dependent alcohol dehydrogenase family protein n=1 Tax=Hahella sp. (strain CCB-MM4) TaxID=1926491 RepID=UPI000B9BD4A7|nr:NAD(P)-dependent alcohol dehydrogenase [Hahella sp. CCB-MM4]OZG71754.1 NAD(P)-dependent alcohol dehydrogenase [Hahella sp. CCB-MM4]